MRTAACVLGVLAGLGVAGAAQGRQTLEEIVATRLARAAVMQARVISSPTIDEYRLTALALGRAMELDPDNDEILRMQIEAWTAADNEDEAVRATRRLVRLDPSDTVAQLSALSAEVRSLQRIEDRIALYERLLGPAGERLNRAVRSRLAFDAALLHRELGDESRFLDHVRLALDLDQTNKPAALLASTVFLERVDDPVSRCEMHIQLLLADPLDPQSHLAFASELQSYGAYRGAQRFLTNAATLRALQGVAMSEELMDLFYAVSWGVEGAEGLLARLEEEEASMRYAVDSQRRAVQAAGEDPATVPDAQTHPSEDRVRALMSAAVGRDAQAAAFFDRYRNSISQSFVNAVESGMITQAQLEDFGGRLVLDRIRVRALTGLDVATAEEELNTLLAESDNPVRDDSISRYRGLLAAQRGDRAEAERLLGGMNESDPERLLGLAIAAERSGDPREAARRYAVTVRDAPGSIGGLIARERLRLILGSDIQPSDTAWRLDELAQDAPDALERYIAEPSEYLSLRVEFEEDALDMWEPLTARVTLHNGGVFPLGIGTSAPIQPRVVVAPKLSINGAPVRSLIGPEFTSLARRLRLGPGESVVVDVALDLGSLGTLVDATAPLAASLRCQAIQAYMHSEERGVYAPGVYGLEAGSRVVWRRPAQPSPPFEDILERITSLSGEEFATALSEAQWFFAKNITRDEEETISDHRRQLAEAIAQRYPTMSELERLFTLLSVPGAWQVEEARAVDDAAREADQTSLTTFVLLLTRVGDGEDPLLAACLDHADPVVREVAQIKSLRFEVMEGLRRLEEATSGEPDPTR